MAHGQLLCTYQQFKLEYTVILHIQIMCAKYNMLLVKYDQAYWEEAYCYIYRQLTLTGLCISVDNLN